MADREPGVMMIHQIANSPELLAYIEQHASPIPDVLSELQKRTAQLRESTMQVSAPHGRFLEFMARLTGAQKILEIGVFTGYSSICLARALPADGKLLALDCSVEWTTIAQEFWAKAGLTDQIELRLGDARDRLDEVIQTPGEAASFDLVFIDADKVNYLAYFEASLTLLKPGGLIIVDNTLWSGQVMDPADTSADTVALREFNQIVANDNRVTGVLLPLVDGVTLLRKTPTTPFTKKLV